MGDKSEYCATNKFRLFLIFTACNAMSFLSQNIVGCEGALFRFLLRLGDTYPNNLSSKRSGLNKSRAQLGSARRSVKEIHDAAFKKILIPILPLYPLILFIFFIHEIKQQHS